MKEESQAPLIPASTFTWNDRDAQFLWLSLFTPQFFLGATGGM